jgi:hypothetical protein
MNLRSLWPNGTTWFHDTRYGKHHNPSSDIRPGLFL